MEKIVGNLGQQLSGLIKAAQPAVEAIKPFARETTESFQQLLDREIQAVEPIKNDQGATAQREPEPIAKTESAAHETSAEIARETESPEAEQVASNQKKEAEAEVKTDSTEKSDQEKPAEQPDEMLSDPIVRDGRAMAQVIEAMGADAVKKAEKPQTDTQSPKVASRLTTEKAGIPEIDQAPPKTAEKAPKLVSLEHLPIEVKEDKAPEKKIVVTQISGKNAKTRRSAKNLAPELAATTTVSRETQAEPASNNAIFKNLGLESQLGKISSEAMSGQGDFSAGNRGASNDSTSQQFNFMQSMNQAQKAGATRLADLPTMKQQLGQQFDAMLQKARIMVKDNENARMTAQLYPKELGKVSMRLALVEGQLQGRFFVENEMVQRELLSRMDRVIDELKQDGYDVNSFTVDVGTRGGNQAEASGSESRFNDSTGSPEDLAKATPSKAASEEVYA